MIGGLAEAVAATIAYAGVGARVVPIALPDEFLAAGALSTLHERYGLSTDRVIATIRAELGGLTSGSDGGQWPADTDPPCGCRELCHIMRPARTRG